MYSFLTYLMNKIDFSKKKKKQEEAPTLSYAECNYPKPNLNYI